MISGLLQLGSSAILAGSGLSVWQPEFIELIYTALLGIKCHSKYSFDLYDRQSPGTAVTLQMETRKEGGNSLGL